MPFSGVTPTHPTHSIQVATQKENRTLATVGSTTITADYIINSYEIRDRTFTACNAFIAANDNSVYKQMNAKKLANDGGLLTFITETIDLTPS